MIEGYLDQGRLPRQGRGLRRPGGRRRLCRPAQGGLRQRRRLPGGKGRPAPGPVHGAGADRRGRGHRFPGELRDGRGRPAARSSSRAPSRAKRVRVQVVGERGGAPGCRDRSGSSRRRRAGPNPGAPISGRAAAASSSTSTTGPSSSSKNGTSGGRSKKAGVTGRRGPVKPVTALARPLRLPEQDGVRLRGAAGARSSLGLRERATRPASPAAGRSAFRNALSSAPPSSWSSRTSSTSPRARASTPRHRPAAGVLSHLVLRRGEADGRAHGPPGDRRPAEGATSAALAERLAAACPGAEMLRPRHEPPRLRHVGFEETRRSSPAPRSSRKSWPASPSGSTRQPSSRPTRPRASSSTAGSATWPG